MFLRVPVADVDAAISEGALPLAYLGIRVHVDTRRLLALMGTPYDRRK